MTWKAHKSREALEEELSTQHLYLDFHLIILQRQICLDTYQQNMGLLDWPNPLKHPILIFLHPKGLKFFPFVLMAQVVPCQINTFCQQLTQNTTTDFVSTNANVQCVVFWISEQFMYIFVNLRKLKSLQFMVSSQIFPIFLNGL